MSKSSACFICRETEFPHHLPWKAGLGGGREEGRPVGRQRSRNVHRAAEIPGRGRSVGSSSDAADVRVLQR